MALLVYPHSQLVALSDDPGKAGAGYVHSTDLTWKDEVRALCGHAEGIFLVPFDFEGTAWEVGMIVESGWRSKTFFVMPARSPINRWFGSLRLSLDYRQLWENGRARYSMLTLPEYDGRGGVIHIGDSVRVFKGFGGRSFSNDDSQSMKNDLEELRKLLRDLSAANKPG